MIGNKLSKARTAQSRHPGATRDDAIATRIADIRCNREIGCCLNPYYAGQTAFDFSRGAENCGKLSL
jgi:hypothetical protein